MVRSVLVVDDDEPFRELASRLLTVWGHDVVGEAGTVQDALIKAAERRPDTVLTDIALPDGDGEAMTLTDLPPALRIVIGEDDVLLREGIARLLTDAGLQVVAQSGDAEDLLRKALAYRPDVAIIDVRMPPHHDDDGLVAAIELRRRLPNTGVLILSQFNEPSLALDLIGDHAGGIGYLLKERVGDLSTFLEAIGRVAAGGSALDAQVVQRMLGRRAPEDPLHGLSPKEHAVLAAMAEGKSNVGIAETLHVSEAAVEKHVTAILRKLGIRAASTEHRRVHAVLTYLQASPERR